MIGRISFFVNPYKEEAYTVAKHIISICEHKDIACSVAHNADELSSCELIAAIGGDGTLLRTAERAAILDIPVLGVNLGRIGFLSEVAPDEFENALEMIDRGDYKVQNLMMLECYVNSRRIAAALNDVIVYKPKFFEIAYFNVSTNEGPIGEVYADGVIASTPTGSTAYSISVGGPIVDERLEAITLVPICSHSLTARPCVLPPYEDVYVKMLGDGLLSVDGIHEMQLHEGDKVTIKKAPFPTKMLRLTPRNPYSLVREKLL